MCLVSMGEQMYHGLLDRGASNTLVAERLVEQGQTQMGEMFGVKVGSGDVQLTSGETERGSSRVRRGHPFLVRHLRHRRI